MKNRPMSESVVYQDEYIFITEETTPKKKTSIFYIFDRNAVCIAHIKWYSSWRKYCFFPQGEGTIWDTKCLLNIFDFMYTVDRKYKEERKKKNNG